MARAPLAILFGLVCGCATHLGDPGEAGPERGNGRFSVERGIVYGYGGPDALEADVWSPAGAGPFPAVIVIHGGGWTRGHRSDMDGIAERLARRGYVAVNVSYRFAPADVFPAAIHDVKQAVRWTRENAARYGIDPARIGAYGYSAGGHLAMMLATTDVDDGFEGRATPGAPGTRLRAVVAGGAPVDLRRYGDGKLVPQFLGVAIEDDPEVYVQASPIVHVTADDPSAFLYHGTWDWIVEVGQATAMKEALDGAGVPAELFLLRGRGHVAAFLWGSSAVDAAIAFLDRRL